MSLRNYIGNGIGIVHGSGPFDNYIRGCLIVPPTTTTHRSCPLTWIKTIPTAEASDELRKAIEAQKALYPIEYATPVHPTDGTSEIVASHSLIPEALHHSFAAFGAMMSSKLPLSRREHEMITTVVSVTNRCHY